MTTDTTTLPPKSQTHLAWVFMIYVTPRRVFEGLLNRANALLPLFVLCMTTITLTVVQAYVEKLNPPPIQYPEGWEYFSPEQQTQFMQSLELTSGPVFQIIFPSLARVIGLGISWLVLGGLVYLVLTLSGGRTQARTNFAFVAWTMMPLALRDIVRIVALLVTKRLIGAPGISGFAAPDGGLLNVFWSQILARIDLYMFWMLGLLVFGILVLDPSLPPARSRLLIVGVKIALLIVGAVLGTALVQLGNLSIVKPFLF